MQLASQCLRHLNRARLGRWQPHQGLDQASCPPRTSRTNFCTSRLCGRPCAAESLAPDYVRSQPDPRRRLGASGHARFDIDARPTRRTSPGLLKVHPVTRPLDTNNSRRLEVDEHHRQASDWCLREADLGLVDIPDNENDAGLWLSLLDAARREHGEDGAFAIWDAVERRKALFEVDSERAESFWAAMLEAVLHDETRLWRIFLYANWMLSTHSAQWPSLYSTTISYCLRNSQYARAMQWHLRLMPKFDAGPEAFGVLLRQFVANSDAGLQQVLESLYATALHRNLYDEIIPILYENGLSQLCAKWRLLFLRCRDLPEPTAKSQPYLQFLARYYPGTQLELEEQMVVDMNSPAYWNISPDSLIRAMDSTQDAEGGPKGRRYSDSWGARWFASSWVPLDFAMHGIHALGVRQIGPLSLQSIALREPTPAAVMARIEQLQAINIGIGHSNYARAVRHFAETGDAEMLSELLHTDIHPEVFDDAATQRRIRDNALEAGAWSTYRLLLAIQPAIAQESIDSTSNVLLQQRLAHHQPRQALALMDDMRCMDIDVSPTSVEHIFYAVLDPLPWNPKVDPSNWERLQTAIAFLNRLTLIQKPVPSRHWQKVLFGLGKFGRLDELQDMTLGIVDNYTRCASQGGLLTVHSNDALPSVLGGLAENPVVPADLPVSHDHHPMRRVFSNQALQVAIVRWGFKAALSKDPQGLLAGIGRGVRLLAQLNERGIQPDFQKVQGEVLRCITRLYSRQQASRLPDLVDVKRAIDESARQGFGRPLLPGIITLRERVAREDGQRVWHKASGTTLAGRYRRAGAKVDSRFARHYSK